MVKKFVLIIFSMFIIVCNSCVAVFSIQTGFSTTEISLKDKQTFISNLEFSLFTEELQKIGIECFDVSKSELIAIGTKNSEHKYISIYDKNGEFQYGYSFNCSGNFALEWDDMNLIIYFVRSDVSALINSNGDIIELRMIENTIENNWYWNNSVFAEEKIVGENIYTTKNNMGILNVFASSYSQLIKTDLDGNETIIYNSNTPQITNIIIWVIFILVFALIVIYGLKKKML